MKSACDTCFDINMIDSSVVCDVSGTDAVQTVHHKDVEVVRHLYSTAALSTQVLHITRPHSRRGKQRHSIRQVLHTTRPHSHRGKQRHSIRSTCQATTKVNMQFKTATKQPKILSQNVVNTKQD